MYVNLGFYVPLFKSLFFLCSKGLTQFEFWKNSLCSGEEGRKVHLVTSAGFWQCDIW